MYIVTYFCIVFVWTVFTNLCGAFWVTRVTPQNALSDQSATAGEAGEGVHEALVKAAIIPDVLDDFQPSVYVTLSYPSRHKTVNMGNKIKPKKVTSPPIFNIDISAITPTRTLRSNTTYTLVLSDPDATSRADPVKAQMCHWIITNLTLPFPSAIYDGAWDWLLPRSSLRDSKSNGIQEIMPYLPPTPPPKTGYHRYVFVLLAPAAAETEEGPHGGLTKPKDRPHWGYGKIGAGVREWATENDLVAVGANFFYSQNKKQ